MDKLNSKAALREKMLAVLKAIPPAQRQSDSEKICARLEQQEFFKTARAILFFAPLPEEANLWPLLPKALAAGKMAALPCFDAENQRYTPRRVSDLHVEILPGRFGIREPAPACLEIPPDDLDLVLVPGVAFDRHGRRLGRGKGFYDRLLQNTRVIKCAVAFDEQMVEAIPAEAHDVRMDFVVTPTQCLEPVS
ncbi:MAG TPA: 5-formyltetrahydrofolate cyclo-ligase [Verrucomicrobiae bacterium]|nr:5-formyltetrahydrofolate cyclo-ligase [Verrucomicrobiae bacterium]